MYPVLKIMHMLNFLDTFSMGITFPNLKCHNLEFVCDATLVNDAWPITMEPSKMCKPHLRPFTIT